MNALVTFTYTLALLTAMEDNNARTWHSRRKTTLDATIVRVVESGKAIKEVVLRKESDRTEISVKLEDLMESDRNYVVEWAKQKRLEALPKRPTAYPNCDVVTDDEVCRAVATIFRASQRNGARVHFELVLGTPLTKDNLDQLKYVAGCAKNKHLSLARVTTADRQLAAALKASGARLYEFGNSIGSGSEPYLLIGYMNAATTLIATQKACPTEKAMNELLALFCQVQSSVYLFPGAKSVEFSAACVAREAAQDWQAIVWVPGVPADRTFDDFLRMLIREKQGKNGDGFFHRGLGEAVEDPFK